MKEESKVLGEYPRPWPRVRLGDVCAVNPRTPSSRDDHVPTTFLPMASIDQDAGRISAAQVRPYGEIKKGYTSFQENDVLFAKITPCMQNGKHAIAMNLTDGIGFGSTEFHVLRPSPDIIPEWAHYFLRQRDLLREAANHFTGSVGQQRLPDQYLKDLYIPLPPRDIQEALTKKLQNQHKLLKECQRRANTMEKLLGELPASLLNQTFSTLGTRNQEKLGSVCEIVSGSTPSTDTPSFWEGDIVWVTPSDLGENTGMFISRSRRNLTQSGLSASRTKMVPKDTVILSTRASIGHLAISEIPLSLGFGCKGFIHGSDIDATFLYWSLLHAVPRIRDLSNSTTFAEVSKSALSTLTLGFPGLGTQKEIAHRLTKQMEWRNTMRMSIKTQIESLSVLLASLLRQTLYGEELCPTLDRHALECATALTSHGPASEPIRANIGGS